MKWLVRLRSIEWDDGRTDLPRSLDIETTARDSDGAIDRVMDFVTEEYECMIVGCVPVAVCLS